MRIHIDVHSKMSWFDIHYASVGRASEAYSSWFCLFAYGNIVGDKLKVESICTTAVVFLSVSLIGTQTVLVLACG